MSWAIAECVQADAEDVLDRPADDIAPNQVPGWRVSVQDRARGAGHQDRCRLAVELLPVPGLGGELPASGLLLMGPGQPFCVDVVAHEHRPAITRASSMTSLPT